MRVSWKWLQELVEINIEPVEVARLLTMSGIEVDSIENLDKGVKGVKAAVIREITVHPQADKLLVCQVFDGEKTFSIVSGATNLLAGQKVPLAGPGAVLPGGKRIERTLFRGIESEGMLCSAQELGLDVDKLTAGQKDGIYILTEDTPVGSDILEVLGLDDYVLELGLTPNRADCLSMINVAREVAALTGAKTKLPEISAPGKANDCSGLTSIKIVAADLCKRYVARIIRDIRIAPSPMWLQHRLMAAGVRPISNIVDVTNYVMLEMGQPLHAFDYDRLAENRIIVRKANEGETLETLDGQNRKLSPEMLVIADAKQAVGLAGVMGGSQTEVTGQTKTILLESASFHGPNIRRTSQALGLRSEASLRFEKGVNLEQANLAADRAIQLMAALGAGTPVSGSVDCYPVVENKLPLKLRLSRINQILGTAIEHETVEKILLSLNITIIKKDKESWVVTVPSYRRDLEGEIDLIEEVARLYGYDKIPTTLPYGATTQGMKTKEQNLRHKVGNIMSALGLHEIITYSFINPRHCDLLRLPDGHELRDMVIVKNPLSEEQGVMRTTLLPGLLDIVMKNLNKRNNNFMIFELGKVYLKNGFPEQSVLPAEKWALGAAAVGKREKTWAYGEIEYDFYYLKGVIEKILSGLGISDYTFKAASELPWFHPGRQAVIMLHNKEIGWLGEVHPLVLENYGIDQKTITFSLDFDAITEAVSETIKYRQLAKYPAITRDLAVIVPEYAQAADVAAVISGVGKEMLKELRLFDLYRGKQIETGFKSLAFSLTWQTEAKTLTDDEINTLHEEIMAALNKGFGADFRRA